MADPTTPECPIRQLFTWHMSTKQCFNLIWRSRPETRDVAIPDPDKGNDGDQIGEEQVAR